MRDGRTKMGCTAFWSTEALVGVVAGISAFPLMISMIKSINVVSEKFQACLKTACLDRKC